MTHPSRLPRTIALFALIATLGSCKQGPNEATMDLEPQNNLSEAHRNIRLDVHRIVVKSVLPAQKYLYLKVDEADRSYWVATRPSDIVEGEAYLYNEALLKTAFESRELGRVFDTLYLVTQLVPEDKAKGMEPSRLEKILKPGPRTTDGAEGASETPSAVSLGIGELLGRAETLEGQWVEISGTCTKVNTGILQRNWVHLTDEADGSEIVVTTQDAPSPGDRLNMVARVGINRDFGAGYSYPVLLEQGRRTD